MGNQLERQTQQNARTIDEFFADHSTADLVGELIPDGKPVTAIRKKLIKFLANLERQALQRRKNR